jgi:hypothetical protein
VQKFDNYSLNPRVFVEDFAAKLPTPPQFTVYALRLFKRWLRSEELVAGESAKGVGAKFRNCWARFGWMVVLNFDPTPFALVTPFASNPVCLPFTPSNPFAAPMLERQFKLLLQ